MIKPCVKKRILLRSLDHNTQTSISTAVLLLNPVVIGVLPNNLKAKSQSPGETEIHVIILIFIEFVYAAYAKQPGVL